MISLKFLLQRMAFLKNYLKNTKLISLFIQQLFMVGITNQMLKCPMRTSQFLLENQYRTDEIVYKYRYRIKSIYK